MAGKDIKGIINFLSFVSVGLIGVTLLLSKLGLFSGIASALIIVANVLAYIITAIAAFYYVRSKKNVWVWIVYIVSIVLIVISYIINIG